MCLLEYLVLQENMIEGQDAGMVVGYKNYLSCLPVRHCANFVNLSGALHAGQMITLPIWATIWDLLRTPRLMDLLDVH